MYNYTINYNSLQQNSKLHRGKGNNKNRLEYKCNFMVNKTNLCTKKSLYAFVKKLLCQVPSRAIELRLPLSDSHPASMQCVLSLIFNDHYSPRRGGKLLGIKALISGASGDEPFQMTMQTLDTANWMHDFPIYTRSVLKFLLNRVNAL
jgi:hypothetical protein